MTITWDRWCKKKEKDKGVYPGTQKLNNEESSWDVYPLIILCKNHNNNLLVELNLTNKEKIEKGAIYIFKMDSMSPSLL